MADVVSRRTYALFSTIERLSLEACHMLGSVLFWLLGSNSDYKVPKIQGLVKSHSVRKGGHRQEKMQKCPVLGKDVLLTNEVQDGKDQAWPPRKDWLTNA